MPMKPTPMPKKTGKPKKTMGMNMGGMPIPGGDPRRPIMLPKTGMSKGGMAKSKGMAYGGMTEKPMGMAKGGMAKKGKK